MARLPRVGPVGVPQHIIQRGNNRQVCFASEQDQAVYIDLLDEYASQFDVSIHAWVLMTNHVHLLATPNMHGGVSNMMQALGKRIKLHTPHDEYIKLGTEPIVRQDSYRALFHSHLRGQLIDDIRSALNKGMALGDARFKDEIEYLHGRRVRPGKMGRPVIDVP